MIKRIMVGYHEEVHTLQRVRDVRALWNKWDPIGVSGLCNEDEYDSYIGNTLQLLEQKAAVGEIEKYLCFVAYELMGLELRDFKNGTPKEFALSLRLWRENNC